MKYLKKQVNDKVYFWHTIKVGLLPSKKICYLVNIKPFKNDEKCFLFHLKTLFVLKIFEFLSQLIGHVGKTA